MANLTALISDSINDYIELLKIQKYFYPDTNFFVIIEEENRLGSWVIHYTTYDRKKIFFINKLEGSQVFERIRDKIYGKYKLKKGEKSLIYARYMSIHDIGHRYLSTGQIDQIRTLLTTVELDTNRIQAYQEHIKDTIKQMAEEFQETGIDPDDGTLIPHTYKLKNYFAHHFEKQASQCLKEISQSQKLNKEKEEEERP